MWTIEIGVYSVLGLLGIFALWIIVRAIITRDLVGAAKQMGFLVVLVVALFGSVYVWVRIQQRIPGGITAARIQAEYRDQIARLRELARGLGSSHPPVEYAELLTKTELLAADLILPTRRVLIVQGTTGHHLGQWTLPDLRPGKNGSVRGWGALHGEVIDTIE